MHIYRTWRNVIGRYGLGKENERGERLLNFCSVNNLVITNTLFEKKTSKRWTWQSPDGITKNLIDYIIVNNRWKSSVQDVRVCSAEIGSDHRLVMTRVKLRLKKEMRQNTINSVDIEKLEDTQVKKKYQEELQEKLTKIKEDTKVEEHWSNFRKAILQTAETILGKKTRNKQKEWVSEEVIQLCNKRRNMRRNKEDRHETNWLSREIKRKIRRDKEAWIQQCCNDIQEHFSANRTREAYRIIKQLSGNYEMKTTMVMDKNGNILTDTTKIMERWKEYFEELYNCQTVVDSEILEDLPSNNSHESTEDFLMSEVENAIHELKRNKAPGIDGITGEIIQAGGDAVSKSLHNLMQKIYDTETIPDDWGKGIIVPIYKKKGDKTDCRNYRGITLLSIPGKILTKVLQQRLQTYVEMTISEEQAGFRPGRSTIDQLFTIRQVTEKYIEGNQTCYINFIDYKQAFDSVWRQGLWQSMRNAGIAEKLIKLIQAIYHKAESAVKKDKQLTDWFKTEVGTRQGCTLSPYLFLIIIEVIFN